MELRKDPITRSWVITGDDMASPQGETRCRFCPDSPDAPQVIATRPSLDGAPWSSRAVVHPNPLYRIEGEPQRRGDGLYDRMRPVGAHEVLVENPRHDGCLWNSSDAEIDEFLLLTANRVIADHLDSRSFITMTYAVLDLERGSMTYARAGHTPLIYLPGSGNGASEPQILTPSGMVLGLRFDGAAEKFVELLEEDRIPLQMGDVIVFYTDGITEAMNADSDLFGEERLVKLVEEHGHLPPEELRERILREIDAFVAGAPQHDDMTMILLKVDDFVPGAVKTGFANERS